MSHVNLSHLLLFQFKDQFDSRAREKNIFNLKNKMKNQNEIQRFDLNVTPI